MAGLQAARYEEAVRSIPAWLAPAASGLPIFILPCGRRKKDHRAPANELYLSHRFQTAVAFLENINQRYFIASAKHGLITSHDEIEPYDVDLSGLSKGKIVEWKAELRKTLRETAPSGPIVVLGSDHYTQTIADALSQDGRQVFTPQADLNPVYQTSLLHAAKRFHLRATHASKIYDAISGLVNDGVTFRLGEIGNQSLPSRGVYLFLDDTEPSVFGPMRIVRIGTHGVSEGSKATLRGRLRNHFGLRSGGGNHRGSVFRLHVGRALLESRHDHHSYASWGTGQHAGADTLAAESALEREVSEYLAKLRVVVMRVDDAPSKRSARAVIESNMIALLTENGLIVDPSSEMWLGRHSPIPQISSSGLWNVRDIGRRYDERKLQLILDHLAWELT